MFTTIYYVCIYFCVLLQITMTLTLDWIILSYVDNVRNIKLQALILVLIAKQDLSYAIKVGLRAKCIALIAHFVTMFAWV